jgi:hypothetical protein
VSGIKLWKLYFQIRAHCASTSAFDKIAGTKKNCWQTLFLRQTEAHPNAGVWHQAMEIAGTKKIAGKHFFLQSNTFFAGKRFFCRQTLFFAGNAFLKKKKPTTRIFQATYLKEMVA